MPVYNGQESRQQTTRSRKRPTSRLRRQQPHSLRARKAAMPDTHRTRTVPCEDDVWRGRASQRAQQRAEALLIKDGALALSLARVVGRGLPVEIMSHRLEHAHRIQQTCRQCRVARQQSTVRACLNAGRDTREGNGRTSAGRKWMRRGTGRARSRRRQARQGGGAGSHAAVAISTGAARMARVRLRCSVQQPSINNQAISQGRPTHDSTEQAQSIRRGRTERQGRIARAC